MNEYETYEKLRDLKGLKNADVARLAEIPPSTFTDWKHGKSIPKYEKMTKIAKVLGVRYVDLAGIEVKSWEEVHPEPTRFETLTPAWALELIDLYCNATPDAQKSVMTLLRNSQKRNSSSSKEA